MNTAHTAAVTNPTLKVKIEGWLRGDLPYSDALEADEQAEQVGAEELAPRHGPQADSHD